MKKLFNVEIKETLKDTFEIEAENSEEAEYLAEKGYHDGKYILDRIDAEGRNLSFMDKNGSRYLLNNQQYQIKLNIEIDVKNKDIYIGEENTSGVKEKFGNIEEIIKYIRNYLEVYHEKDLVHNLKLIEIKRNVEQNYEFLKYQSREKIDEKQKIINKAIQKDIDKKLEMLWNELEDIAFVEKESVEYLDEQYLDFEPGITEKEDIWHWFDERYSKGVYYLIYDFNKGLQEEEEME